MVKYCFALIVSLLVAADFAAAIQKPVFHKPNEREYQPPLPVGCFVTKLTYTEEACHPTVERVCKEENAVTKEPKKRNRCFDFSVPVCTMAVDTKTVEVCGKKFEQVEEDLEVELFDVGYAKRCEYQNITICHPVRYYNPGYPPRPAYGYQRNFHDCKEKLKKVCFATPIIKPNNTDFTVVYPKEVEGECLEAQVKVCTDLVELEDGSQRVMRCDVRMAQGNKCEDVTFDVPKTVCKERPEPFEIPEDDK